MRRRQILLHAACALAVAFRIAPARAQNVHPAEAPSTLAVPLTEPLRLDGRLDEAVWNSAPAATEFRQAAPREGEPATQRTEIRFAFDDAAIYVGARMFDDSGAAGVRTQLVRRDASFSSDYLQVIFDTYHDHIGRLFFLVNPSGVKQDANGLGGGGDPAWDPVWEVQTAIDSLGWTAEMRIPFAELRYPRTSDPQTWGLQIWRQVNRLNEISMWSWWASTESGGPSRFGHLTGIVVTSAPGRGELLPYTVGRYRNAPVNDPANPFEDDHATDGRMGADLRVLLTSNLTLNATINPDFGQVEVDPQVVNLSAFETVLEERRPFFVEGAGYFGFSGINCYFCSNVSSLSMLNTRRIGRRPQLPAQAPAGGYADVPENSTILGAAKLTGRTRSGWSIGVMDAYANRARATLQDSLGARSAATVEPATNFLVARVQRDLRGGATVLRGFAASVRRNLESDFQRRLLPAHTEAAGIATDMYFQRRNYRLMAQLAGTYVSGDTAVINQLQRAPQRYFQRPDRQHGSNGVLSDRYDSTATSLRGLGAYARFSRDQGGLLWEIQGNVRTPGFENNDITFLSRADYAWMSGNALRQWLRPTRWFRQLFFIAGGQQQYNFDGDLTDRQLQLFGYYQALNYWQFRAFVLTRPELYDDRLSRGGVVLKRPSVDVVSFGFDSDSRRKVVLSWFVEANRTGDGDGDVTTGVTAQIRPRSNVSLSVGPFYNHDENSFQFRATVADTANPPPGFFGRRHVFARVVQHTLSMNTRINVTFSTNLTFELFMQPFINAQRWGGYREYAAPRTARQLVYGVDAGRDSLVPGSGGAPDQVFIDPDGDTTTANSFTLTDRTTTLRSLRGNAVLRWEYRPGSTLFVVWTRDAATSVYRGDVEFGSDTRALLEGPSTSIFLIKVNYRIGL